MTRRKRKPVRLVHVFKPGKEHEGHIDGVIVHPDDRIVRELPPPPEKADEEPRDG